MSTGRIVIVLSIVIVAVTAVYWLSVGRSEIETQQELRLGLPTWPGLGPVYVANSRGYFGEVEVVPVLVEDADARRAAYRAGDLDLIAETVDSLAFAVSVGLEAKIVLVTDESYGGDGIVAVDEISTVRDLVGKRVAYPVGFTSHFLLLSVLAAEGLSEQDIRPQRVPDPGKAAEAFLSGAVDAAVTWEPFLSQARQEGRGKILLDTTATPGRILGIIAASPRSLSTKREALLTFVGGWLRAVDDVLTAPDAASKEMASGFGMSSEDVGAILGSLRFADFEANRGYFGLEPTDLPSVEQTFALASKVWNEAGLTTRLAEAEEVLPRAFLQETLGSTK